MASGSITGTTGNQFITAKVDWSSTPNTANNNSTVTATLYYRKSSSSTSPTWGTYSGGVTINGVTTKFSKYIEVNNNNTWLNIGTATATVPHNSDGKKTITISAFGGISGISFDHTTLSGSAVLDNIPRQATITAAPNFTDEQNPKITYSNPAGNNVASLEACISFDGSANNIAYRSISKTGTSYTFSLTSAERDILRSGVTNAKSKSVRFYIRTTIGSTTYTSYLTKTLTITNANPTLSPTVVDTNSTTIALTGSANTLVRYYSNAKVTFGATALKKATIKSRKVTCGNKSLTADGTINAISSGEFKFTVTDSRGYSTTKTVEPSCVNYVKLTCSLSENKPNAEGEMLVSATGKCFTGSFGAVDNEIMAYYRYKPLGGNYGEDWLPLTVTPSGTSYVATASLTGLDYQTTYVFQAYAVDKLATTAISERTVRTVPVFDWSDTDFNVNGQFGLNNAGTVLRHNPDNGNVVLSANNPVNGVFLRPNGTGSSEGQVCVDKDGRLIMGGSSHDNTAVHMDGSVILRHNVAESATVLASNGGDIYFRTSGHSSGTNQAHLYSDGTFAAYQMKANKYIDINGVRFTGVNKTLWTGSWFMTADHTADLSENISDQPNGVVLIFSAYSGGAVQNYEFTFHFIPKAFVSLQEGRGVSLFMHDNTFSYAGQKYLYIGNNYITGHDNNNTTGTGGTGIKFDNARYIMRYVIGV